MPLHFWTGKLVPALRRDYPERTDVPRFGKTQYAPLKIQGMQGHYIFFRKYSMELRRPPSLLLSSLYSA